MFCKDVLPFESIYCLATNTAYVALPILTASLYGANAFVLN